MDDILEIIHKGEEENFTKHLNTVDKSGSIKFTHETEEQGKIPFLDTLIVRQDDGRVKVYRKPTHTDQYLLFESHHPLIHKLGVIRTLMDRRDSIITDPDDRLAEEHHITKALTVCGYPKWSFHNFRKAKEHNNSNSPRKV